MIFKTTPIRCYPEPDIKENSRPAITGRDLAAARTALATLPDSEGKAILARLVEDWQDLFCREQGRLF